MQQLIEEVKQLVPIWTVPGGCRGCTMYRMDTVSMIFGNTLPETNSHFALKMDATGRRDNFLLGQFWPIFR